MKFAIVVASYNNEYWCSKNICSIASQSYTDFHLYYINDASTDETGELASLFTQIPELQGKATLIHNKERRGALENIYTVVQQIEPECVVVCVDGDDWLAHDKVLEKLAEVYRDKEVWLSYGSFETEPPSNRFHRSYPKAVCNENSYRRHPFLAVHLKTFYAKLFHCIKKEDLMEAGSFFSTCSDLGFMFPMLEMATGEHCCFIDEILYTYNASNPLNDAKSYLEELRSRESYIRTKNPYMPIKNLF